MPVHFAHAHFPGGGESTNASTACHREYFPKGVDITGCIHYLQAVADEIDDRPGAILGFRTPQKCSRSNSSSLIILG
jgi:IS30 family transposase